MVDIVVFVLRGKLVEIRAEKDKGIWDEVIARGYSEISVDIFSYFRYTSITIY